MIANKNYYIRDFNNGTTSFTFSDRFGELIKRRSYPDGWCYYEDLNGNAYERENTPECEATDFKESRGKRYIYKYLKRGEEGKEGGTIK